MARMPGTEWLGEHGKILMTEASLNKICVHTIAGRYPAHPAHISIRGDGKRGQSRDTRFRSAANLQGNDDVIAIEMEDTGPYFPTWDHENGKKVPGFTQKQIVSLAETLVWGHRTHGIPLLPCPNSKDASEGIAYHRQGIDGNFKAAGYQYGGRVPGGESWTEHFGKVCPGDERITQLLTIVIPLARRMAGLDQEEKEEEMANIELIRGDAKTKTPNGRYSWSDFVFVLEYGAEYPGGAARRYLPGSTLVQQEIVREMEAKFGKIKQWPQARLDAVYVVPGGEIPPEMYDISSGPVLGEPK